MLCPIILGWVLDWRIIAWFRDLWDCLSWISLDEFGFGIVSAVWYCYCCDIVADCVRVRLFWSFVIELLSRFLLLRVVSSVRLGLGGRHRSRGSGSGRRGRCPRVSELLREWRRSGAGQRGSSARLGRAVGPGTAATLWRLSGGLFTAVGFRSETREVSV